MSEEVCRKVFEKYFNKEFPRTRPRWLTFNGKRLELDGYCEEIGIAFEYQGEYHYIDIPHFGKDVEEVQETDRIKKDLCKEKGVLVIQIPYWIKEYYDIEKELKKQLEVDKPKISTNDVLLYPRMFIETFLWIIDERGRIVPFILNNLQIEFYEMLMSKYWKEYWINGIKRYRLQGIREIILKARQFGLSTFISGLYFHDSLINSGTATMIYCQDHDFSSKMLQKHQLFHMKMPDMLRPKLPKGSKDLFFPNLSKIEGGSPGVTEQVAGKQGRSTTIQNLHASEFAEWSKGSTTMKGLLESIPNTGNIIIESSPKKIGDSFHGIYINGKKSDIWHSNFYPWFKFKKYRAEVEAKGELNKDEKELIEKHGVDLYQIQWRRNKIAYKHGNIQDFLHEYPEDDIKCFQSEANLIFDEDMRRITCNSRKAIKGNIHVIGCDTGLGYGGNNSAITVIDTITMEQIYHWYGQIAPENFAHKIHEVWEQYIGLIGIESNGIGLAVIAKAYEYTDWLQFIFCNNRSHGGYLTTSATKGSAIFQLRSALREGILKLSSERIVEEMGWFQDQGNGKMGAEEGNKEITDDSIMSLVIAHDIIKWVWQIEDVYKEYH
jgi:hypothetical protein